MRAPLALLGFALLAGCGNRNDDVGGVSPDEDRQLNEAAAAYDVNSRAAVDNEFVVANADAPDNAGNAQ